MNKTLLILAMFFAPLQTPQPEYSVEVTLDRVSTGTATFAVDRAGAVSGTMHLETPNIVDANLSGSVKDRVWTFEFPFTMPQPNCTGTATGKANINADRSLVEGSLTISGACAPQTLTGTFTFKKTK